MVNWRTAVRRVGSIGPSSFLTLAKQKVADVSAESECTPAPEWQIVPQEVTNPQKEWETQPRRQTSNTAYQFMLPPLQ